MDSDTAPAPSPSVLTHLYPNAVLRCFREGISGVRRVATLYVTGDWDRPTPCRGWTATDLAGHLSATADEGLATLRTLGATGEPTRMLGEEELAEHNAKTLVMLPAQTGPRHISGFGRHAEQYADLVSTMPTGLVAAEYGERTFTLTEVLGSLAVEWHVHAWDLATTIGADYRPSCPELLASIFTAAMPYLSLGSGTPWAAVLRGTGRRVDDGGRPPGRSTREVVRDRTRALP